MRVAQYSIHDSFPFKIDTVFEIRPFTILEGDNITGKSAMVEMLTRFFHRNADDEDYVRLVDSDEKIYADKTTADDIRINWSAMPLHTVGTDPYDGVVDDNNVLANLLAKYTNSMGCISKAFSDSEWRTSYSSCARSLRNMLFKVARIWKDDKYVWQMIHIDKPERYLSERNVALLTTVLMQIASEGKVGFIIETHSQAVIDRARIEIREGRGVLDHKDLSLIHFAHSDKTILSDVSNISFDKMSNMRGTPDGYHDWEWSEHKRLMGFINDGH